MKHLSTKLFFNLFFFCLFIFLITPFDIFASVQNDLLLKLKSGNQGINYFNEHLFGGDVISRGMIDKNYVPVPLSLPNGVKQVSTGKEHICLIDNDDKLYCFGKNSKGQLGNNTTDDNTIATLVYDNGSLSGTLGGQGVISVSAGTSYTCAINSENKLYCWGYNNNGQLGDNTTTTRNIPVLVNGDGLLGGGRC